MERGEAARRRRDLGGGDPAAEAALEAEPDEADAAAAAAHAPTDAAGAWDYPRHEGGMGDCVPDLPDSVAPLKAGRIAVLATAPPFAPAAPPRILCAVGPCWPMIFVTVALMVCVPVGMYRHMLHSRKGLPPQGAIWVAAATWTVMVVSYFRTAFSDPGILPRSNHPQSYYPPGAAYCSDTGVIIDRFDHFCPWTGTAIGAGNATCFNIFVASMCLTLFVLFGGLFIRAPG
eukprot:TRINITY_DN39742_c0_g1_i2.p2 TRINITY_DN39742_c0_g1~~TRINITY_DN39742_c0_g1_i2.p2  ORF type:complete len:231 (+),score=56.98 TRINITY_DN39742_c0_g1_i2:52-744(+)